MHSNRPTPPSIKASPYNRRAHPSIEPDPVHVPRYYFQSDFPKILPNDPRPLPQIENEGIQQRIDRLPAFNSVYDMNRLAMNNYLVTEGGRTFNRNMITALNIYNQPDTKREIARRWSENSDMSTAEFNRMANSIVAEKVSQLYWNANSQGDWGTQLGTNPVPGLRYPDTQEDVDYNTQVIQQVASGLPMLLNSAVSTSY